MAKPISKLKVVESVSSIVKPIIREGDKKHLLEIMLDGDPNKYPIIKAVGYMPIRDGQAGWISYTITTKGREVLSIEVSEPDGRLLAEDGAKIAFVNQFIDHEAF